MTYVAGFIGSRLKNVSRHRPAGGRERFYHHAAREGDGERRREVPTQGETASNWFPDHLALPAGAAFGGIWISMTNGESCVRRRNFRAPCHTLYILLPASIYYWLPEAYLAP